MIGMISRSYRKNKSVFWIPAAVVLVLSIIMFNLNVASQVETKQLIAFNGDEWEIGQLFEKDWYIKQNTFTFDVDLQEDYQNYLSENSGVDPIPALVLPFAATVGGKSIDAANIQENLDGEGKFTGIYTVTATLPNSSKDGDIQVAIDFASETWVKSPPSDNTVFTVERDTQVPTVTLTGANDGSFYLKDIDLTIEVVDTNFVAEKVDIEIKKDYSDYTPLTPITWNGNKAKITFDQVGYYEIAVTATDKAGNKSETANIAFGNKKIGPKFEIENKDQGLNNFYNEDVKLKLVNPLPITQAFAYITESGTETKFEMQKLINVATYTVSDEGTYSFKADVTDLSGTEELGEIANIVIDKTAPILSVTGITNGTKYNKKQSINVEANDTNFDANLSVLKIRKGDQVETINGAEALENRDFTEDGVYTVELSVYDKAGNESKIEPLTFTIDQTEPVLTISGIENGEFYKDDKNVTIAVEDLTLDGTKTTLEVTKDGVAYSASIELKQQGSRAEASHTFSTPGEYSIKLQSTDEVGNPTATLTKNFEIDKTKPGVSVNGVEDGKKYNTSVELNLVATDKNLDNSKTVLTVTRDGIPSTYNGEEAHNTIPINDEGLYSLKVDYYDKAGNKADFSEIAFTIDKTKPAIGITGVSEGEYYNSNKEVIFSIEEKHLDLSQITLHVTKDGTAYPIEVAFEKVKGGPHKAEARYTFTENGTYEISLNSPDEAGNNSGETTLSFTLDKIAPAIEVTTVENKKEYAEDQLVQMTVTDLNMDQTTVNVTKNGEPYTIDPIVVDGNQATTEHAFTEDGVYEIIIESTDKAKNVSSKIITFTIDKSGPEIEYSIENGTFFKDKEVNLNVSVEDYTLKMPEIEVTRKNGDTITEIPTSEWLEEMIWMITQKKTITVEEEGEYFVTVTATDKFGKTSTKKLQFVIDRTKPVFSITGIPNNGFVQKDNELVLTAEDLHFDSSKIEVKVNGEAIENKWEEAEAGYQLKQTFAKDGIYDVTVNAEDFAGNKADETKHKFTVDNEKPVIQIEKVENGKFYDKKQKATIKVEELNYKNNHVSIEVTRNGEPYSFGQWKNQDVESSLEIPFNDDGDYVVNVMATDAAGNNAEQQSVTFTVDETFPELQIKGVEDFRNYNESKEVEFVVKDTNIDTTTVKVTKNGKSYEVGNLVKSGTVASMKHLFKEEGSYVLQFESTDKSGNKTTHDEIAFIVDKTNPVVKIDGVDHQSFNPTGKRVTVSVDELNYDTNEVELLATKDGQSFDIGTWKSNKKLSSLSYNFNDDGLYTVAIKATDKAGNGPIRASKTFTIDTTKPAIEITGVDNAAYYNVDKPVSVSIRDVNLDVNRISVTRDGRGYNAGGFTTSNQTARLSHNFSQEGDYVIEVEAIDKAGNEFSKQIAFTIDKTKPVITPKFRGESRVIKDGEYINQVFTPEFALDEREDTIVSVTLNSSNVTGRVPTASQEITYRYKVLARDKAGNEETLEISFTVDTTKPALTISGILDGFFNKDQAPTVEYNDKYLDRDRSYVTLNGKPFTNGVKLSEEKDYILKAEIFDLANNVSSRTIVFTIDKTSPVIKFSEPISNQYFNENILPELLIEDMISYDIISQTLNGQPYNLGDPIEEEGKHVLFFEVKDKAGNIQQLSVEFIIDKTAPGIVVEGVRAEAKYTEPVTVSISLDNPTDKIKSVKINGELFEGGVKTVDGVQVITAQLSDINTYEIEVVAYDDAGNEKTKEISFEIAEKSALVKFYENKTLFAGTIVGLVGAAAAGAVALRRNSIRRRESEDI